MTQDSMIGWTTGGAGDGATTYDADHVRQWLRDFFLRNNATDGVFAATTNYPTPLATTAAAGSVNTAAGAACVYGIPYYNDAVVNTAIPTPAADTRVDLIVLRASWAAQTVRITRVAGTEGAGAPALTQTAGVTWDIPLAQVSITTAGVMTLTDTRVFLKPMIAPGALITADLADNILSADAAGLAKMQDGYLAASAAGRAKMADDFIQTAHIQDAQVTAAKIANRTRKVMIAPCATTGVAADTYLGFELNNNATEHVSYFWQIPQDFVSDLKVAAIIQSTTGTGNARLQMKACVQEVADASYDWYQPLETYTIATALIPYRTTQVDLSGAESVAGAIVNGEFYRFGADAADTLSGNLYVLGIEFEYTADS